MSERKLLRRKLITLPDASENQGLMVLYAQMSCLEEKTHHPVIANVVALSSCPGYCHARICVL